MELMTPALDRKPRLDALPENIEYRDTGCDLYPSCLRCPLPRCRYDDAGGAAQMLRTGRDATILRLAERDGLPINRLAEMFGVSRRTIFRVLRNGREQAARARY
jgi:hypothetical protein